MNIHNRLWNYLLDLSIGLVFVCNLNYELKKVTFILIPIIIVLIVLCSMIVIFASSKMIIPKRYIELDGFCKLIKFAIIVCLLQNNSPKLNIVLYVFGLTIVLIDYLNRKKIYTIYSADMYIKLFCEETDIEKKKKKSYKLSWMMFLGVIFTVLLKDSNTGLILSTISMIVLYESVLSVLLYTELKMLKVTTKRITYCFSFFYLVLMITSILNMVGYGGIFLYLILGGAIVPILSTLKEVHMNN